MARYDRIAPLAAPVRDRVFAGWAFFRDVDGSRDADLGRRAKLRFMAYRALRRLLDHGVTGVPAASFERQLDTVQEELGILGPLDPERIQLAAFLQLLRRRSPEAAAAAALRAGTMSEERGNNHAAGEFYGAALEVALQHALAEERVRAQLRMARLSSATGAGSPDAALADALEVSASLPDEALRIEVLEGTVEIGTGLRVAEAREEIAALAARGSNLESRARAAAARARLEMSAGNVARALEVCWHAFLSLSDGDQRLQAARTLARALATMGQRAAADLSLQRAEADALSSEQSFRLRIDAVCIAGHAGEPDVFQERRSEILAALEDSRGACVPYVEAHLDLACAALDCGNADAAREHLHHAIEEARRSHRASALTRAEGLLGRLEAPHLAAAPRIPDENGIARRIAAALAALSAPVPAAGS